MKNAPDIQAKSANNIADPEQNPVKEEKKGAQSGENPTEESDQKLDKKQPKSNFISRFISNDKIKNALFTLIGGALLISLACIVPYGILFLGVINKSPKVGKFFTSSIVRLCGLISVPFVVVWDAVKESSQAKNKESKELAQSKEKTNAAEETVNPSADFLLTQMKERLSKLCEEREAIKKDIITAQKQLAGVDKDDTLSRLSLESKIKDLASKLSNVEAEVSKITNKPVKSTSNNYAKMLSDAVNTDSFDPPKQKENKFKGPHLKNLQGSSKINRPPIGGPQII